MSADETSDELRALVKELRYEAADQTCALWHARLHNQAAGAIDALLARLTAWEAKCDEVGIPHDPDGLVRHHRGNGGMIGAADAMASWVGERRDLRARLTAAEADADRLAAAVGWPPVGGVVEVLRLHDEALALRERPQ